MWKGFGKVKDDGQDRDRKADGRGHDTPLLQGEEAWGNGKRETEGGKL
jgi:hypothetical protein